MVRTDHPVESNMLSNRIPRPMPALLARLLILFSISASFALAGPVRVSADARRASRSDATDLISELVAAFESAVPNATANGTHMLNEYLSTYGNGSFTVPQNAAPLSHAARATALDIVRANFLYGPAVAGGPYYPTGIIGVAKNVLDMGYIQADVLPQLALAAVDISKALAGYFGYNGLQTVQDYTLLYKNQWQNTLPNGPDPGVETNYTQDLFFSMQRLSTSPYQVRRLRPASGDALPFTIPDATATAVSGNLTVQELFRQGRLFYADYRDQQNLTRKPATTGQYAAFCDALFFIHPATDEFLPLAIRTNMGADLTYTPLDAPNDWLLAKIMYNVNDFWFAQWNHLAGTHEAVQIVWMAAIRSISQQHPVFAILSRLMYEAFSIQVLAASVLFSTGGTVDLIFPFIGASAQDYTTRLYENGAGRFQANYFRTNLQSRGLIDYDEEAGPPLKRFPFHEDGSVIHGAIHDFITAFVRSYYPSDADVAADIEIQAWVAEANGPAAVLDFPSEIKSIGVLVDVLTQIAHLASTAHHTVNTNELLQVASTLPFCPTSLYQPPPVTKNANTSVVSFLPPMEKVLEQFTVGSLFARPLLAGTNRTILHMFDDPSMLGRMNDKVTAANKVFMAAMEKFSQEVAARTFDTQGLSQGMPFLWKALDPNVAPYSVAT